MVGNKRGINARIEKETGRVIVFGNVQTLSAEIISNPKYCKATFTHNSGNFFQWVFNKSLELVPASFEEVSAPGATKKALSNLQEALKRFNGEYTKRQIEKDRNRR